MKNIVRSITSLVFLCITAFSSNCWAATITSFQAGSASITTTWVGGVVPGDGDIIVLDHAVIFDRDTTVGTSPSDTTTMAITVNQNGRFIIAPGVEVTCRGSLYNNAGNIGSIQDGVQFGAGSILTFDPSQSTNPQQSYVIKSGYYARYYLKGSANNYAKIQSKEGYGNAFFTQVGSEYGNTFNADYSYFSRLGSNGVIGLATFPNSSRDSVSSITNSIIDNCGKVVLKVTSPNAKIIYTNNTVKNHTSNETYAFRIYGSIDNTWVSEIENNTFSQSVQMITPVKLRVTKNYFGGGVGTSGSDPTKEFSWDLFSNNLIVRFDGVPNVRFNDNIQDNYFCGDRKTPNISFFTIDATTFSRDVSGNIFEHIADSNLGDMVFPTSTNDTSKITFKNNILLPNPKNESPGKLISFFTPGGHTHLYVDILNNTYVTTGIANEPFETGIGTGELEPGKDDAYYGNHVGMISAFKNNIAWTPVDFPYKGAKLVREHSHMQDMMLSANTDYNWGYNLYTGSEGYGYHSWNAFRINSMFSSGTPDLHGGTDNPLFVDTSRNFASYHRDKLNNTSVPAWINGHAYAIGDTVSSSVGGYYKGKIINYRCVSPHTSVAGDNVLGQPGGTVNDWRTSWEFASHQSFRDDPAKISDLIDWVKVGQTPTNSAFRGSGEGGVDVGAVPLANAQKYAILDYTNASTAQMAWINHNFTAKISGNNPNNAGMFWAGYYDILGPGSVSELLNLKDWAVANSANSEKALIHAKQDFISTINPAWSQMDKFDNFEGAKGVIFYNGSAYTDATTTAYSGSTTWQDINYIGYEEPFDIIKITRSAGSGITGVWEYWDGSSWTSLTVTDGTTAFAQSGNVAFGPPANWARTVVNGSRSKYFVRYRITAHTTYPTTTTIKGDDWLNGSATACRGWDSTSGTIVNPGSTLAYNPTPPAGASAKFPYQARVTYWASNHFIASPADFQTIGGSSKRTWPQFLSYRTDQLVTSNGWNGIMGDDGEATSSFYGIDALNTDFVDKTGNTWAAENESKYQDTISAFHALNPIVKFGLNGQGNSIVKRGDWNLAEYHTSVWQSGSTRGITVGDDSRTKMTYDEYLPENNPNGLFGIQIYADTADVVPSRTAPWNRANRGPIVALSKHLIAANEHTYFSYYTRGGYIYNETDDVVLKNNSVWHMATQGIPLFANVKRWGTWFPAMGVDFGTPDSSGYNGGVRDLAWKTGLPWQEGADAGVQQDLTGGAIEVTTDTVTMVGNWGNRKKVRFVGSSLPSPLLENTDYWLANTANGIEICTTDNNAYFASIAYQGAKWSINLTSAGEGTFKIYKVGTEVWRRDYTNAVVLHRPALSTSTDSEYNTPSSSVDLGGIYYPLYSDGTTGVGVTSIALRTGEGAILMKAPMSGGAVDILAPITTPNKSGRYTTSQAVTLSANETATIKYCTTAGCNPSTGSTYAAPLTDIMKNRALTYLRFQAIDTALNVGAVQEVILKKQRRR